MAAIAPALKLWCVHSLQFFLQNELNFDDIAADMYNNDF